MERKGGAGGERVADESRTRARAQQRSETVVFPSSVKGKGRGRWRQGSDQADDSADHVYVLSSARVAVSLCPAENWCLVPRCEHAARRGGVK